MITNSKHVHDVTSDHFLDTIEMTGKHHQTQPSDGTRSRSGCITCRIRKKKCDEQRPVCQACCSRQLACYGFDVPPPTWCTTKASWQEVRESDEAKSLRTLAETRYKISRKVGSKVGGSSAPDPDTSPSLPPAKTKGRPCSPLQLPPWTFLGNVRMLPPVTLANAGVNTWQLHPETIWWDSKMRSLPPISSATSSHEETRLLMLFLDVIHPITHTFYELGASGDRSWMLDRIINNQSLYCSALSISACFEFSLTQPPAINDIGICPRVRNLQGRAIGKLRAEIDKFARMKPTPVEDFVWAGTQLLDVVAHLETLEIFSMLQGHWEMHHQAARRILNHIEICASKTTRGSGLRTSVIENTLSTWSTSDPRRRSMEFSICNFIWIDILAISSFGVTSYIPCSFDYLNLLESGTIRPQDIMGCEGVIMAIVAKIARLEQWKLTHQGQMHVIGIASELARQDKQLKNELQHVIARLERDCCSTNTTRLEEDISLVSIIWAYGAQVLRQEVTRSTEPDKSDIDQTFVNLCLEKLEALPTRLVMRTSWPYTIAGSMSISESQHARFRGIVGRVMQEAQSPGISWKGLMVMEECWRLRRVDRGAKVTWREAMESLGARVILT